MLSAATILAQGGASTDRGQSPLFIAFFVVCATVIIVGVVMQMRKR